MAHAREFPPGQMRIVREGAEKKDEVKREMSAAVDAVESMASDARKGAKEAEELVAKLKAIWGADDGEKTATKSEEKHEAKKPEPVPADDDHGPLAVQEILLAGCPVVGVRTGAAFVRDGELHRAEAGIAQAGVQVQAEFEPQLGEQLHAEDAAARGPGWRHGFVRKSQSIDRLCHNRRWPAQVASAYRHSLVGETTMHNNPRTNAPWRVLIIGSGFAGLGLAMQLRKAGQDDFLILEKAG